MIFYWKDQRGLKEFRSHVDKFLYGGDEHFMREVVSKLKERLEVGCKDKLVIWILQGKIRERVNG